MDETGSGGKMTTSAAQLSAAGGVRWLSATACLSSAPYHFFGSGHTASLFKKSSSLSTLWYSVAVCLYPLHALT